MKQNKLIDTAIIEVTAGKGGDGKVSFRREKYIPRGGPDGGDGGNGGNVYFVADHNMATLMDFRAKPKYKAEEGGEGGKKKRHGKSGDDLIIKLPVGTLIYEVRENGEEVLVGDLVMHEQTLLIAEGGRGGKGNERFKSSTNRTPTQFTKGKEGQRKTIRLEIKLIADIGLVGMPNAGKSTLVNHLTSSNAKTASYPFTTIHPNLGLWKLKSGKSVIVADIPGLIEGASEGKGLGDDFLRHIERTRMLIHMIDPLAISEKDLVMNALESYRIIRKELGDYDADLQKKKEIVVINKIDITEINESFEQIGKEFEKLGVTVFGISAVAGVGLEKLEEEVLSIIDTLPEVVTFEAEKPVKMYTIENLPNKRMVFSDEVEDMYKGDEAPGS
ncbi:MAG: GTPase ObgE [Patescibacteria group bacterium]